MTTRNASASAAGFYAGLSPVERFRDLATLERYRPVPDGATLFVADIVDSTAAIAAGRYKQVNVAAAAVIAGVSNALPGRAVAFSFGGDGASFVLEAGQEAAGRRVLGAAVGWAKGQLGLALRAGAVPVAAIREAGHDLLVARFAVSPALFTAMFAGGGLAFAEARVKGGDFAVNAPPQPVPLDLTGLHCRFAELPARNGVVLSIIVVPAEGGAEAFPAVATELLALAIRREGDVRPVREGAPRLEWTLEKFLLETKAAAAKVGRRSAASLVRAGVANAVANFTIRTGNRVGGFDPERYLLEVVQNTDFRKFDDGLRMTLDCSEATAGEIEGFLRERFEAGGILFGTHRQDAAMLTCFLPAPSAADHVHFVDGAAGGYAYAARALKLRRQAAASFAAPSSLRQANKEDPMSDLPTRPAGEPGTGAPDPDAQDLAAKHGISIEEAKRIVAERGNDRGEIDAEAEKQKLG